MLLSCMCVCVYFLFDKQLAATEGVEKQKFLYIFYMRYGAGNLS